MRPWLIAAAVVLPGLGFVLLGEGFEERLSDAARSLDGWPLAGLVAVLLASDLLLPIPSSVLLAFAGRELGVVPATLAGAAGLTASCEIGYWGARLIGSRLTDAKTDAADRGPIERGLDENAAWWLVLSRPLPILAEAATLLAGLARVPHGLFLAAVVIANVWVAACFSGLGVVGRDWPPAALLTVSAAVPLAVTFAARRWLRGRLD